MIFCIKSVKIIAIIFHVVAMQKVCTHANLECGFGIVSLWPSKCNFAAREKVHTE